MNVYLLTADGRVPCGVPHFESTYVLVDGPCHVCGVVPFKVRGHEQHPSDDDRAIEAVAMSLCCGRDVGTLRVETDTLFGVREDQAVLGHGRARVY